MRRELIALALLAGACGKDAPEAPAKAPRTAAATAEPRSAAGHYRVDVSPPAGCTAGTPCEATFTVTALGDFKVNQEYPHKLVATPESRVTLADGGTFTHVDKHTGKLVVRFTASAAGTAKVAGKLKLSVCTDEACHIEQAPIDFDVPVT